MQPLDSNPCDSATCGCHPVPRREFLKLLSWGAASPVLLRPNELMAGPFTSADGDPHITHFVPADKKLHPDWVRKLFERGEPEVYAGRDLATIGMPVGGLCAGQLYLLGDGTLGVWHIFNRHHFSGYGSENYQYRTWKSPVAHGFSIEVTEGGSRQTRRLNQTGFPEVTFRGEYPMAWVRYAEAGFPVEVELEAYSPFIPLNAKDSTLPATVLNFKVKNRSAARVRTSLRGWLENAVCFYSAADASGRRRSRLLRRADRTLLVHTAEKAPPGSEPVPRPEIVLADFEGSDYGDWQTTGEAFGTGPASGTLKNQQPVNGFQGKGLVNSFLKGDGSTGTLTSPAFRIQRHYLNFLVGGGGHKGKTCVNLLLDGKVVRTATGRNNEKLEWASWNVKELEGREAKLEIVDQSTGAWGHINVDQIEMADVRKGGPVGPIESLEDYGSMVLAVASTAEADPLFSEDPYPLGEKRVPGMWTKAVELAPGQSAEFRFVLAWNFPNHPNGHEYTRRFRDAPSVADYVLDEFDRLSGQTRLWHDTYYESSLPHWLLNRLGSTVANVATGTCQWWENGRFWAWEGVGCCPGTCTHVWNYAQSLARLFPELERSAREMQDLGVALQADGKVSFRGQPHGNYAADGQAGTILKCYREHQMSPDSDFLRRNWEHIRRALEYSIHQDGNDDGLIENAQHNTYDISFFGPNTFIGALYLAALRAGEEMAKEVGDLEFARKVRGIYERGRRGTEQRLWNGEYFIQAVDLKAHPQYQYGQGCLSDQMFGQGWARQLGLGYLYRPNHVRLALNSIYKYNWAPDISAQNKAHKPLRWFVSPGEAGLFTCTWPRSAHLDKGVLYKNEVWTGIEYEVAGNLIWEGMLTEALAIIRGVHDRYHPSKHNPWNEIECGDHYARAMASWGCFLALSGYASHGPRGELRFAPRIHPEDFQSAFTAAGGWGLFRQRRAEGRQENELECRWGRLRVRELELALPEGKGVSRVEARVGTGKTSGGEPVPVQHAVKSGAVSLRFVEAPVVLGEGSMLRLSLHTT